MAHYQYEPLPRGSKSIRLIELMSAASFAAPIRCRIRIVCIAHGVLPPAPKYKAISYAWSNQHESAVDLQITDTAPIFCEGHVLRIPPNLLYALFRLRMQNHLEPLFLWADSICINQADVEERNEQVSFMRDIYSQSDEVVIWLGETMLPSEACEVPQYSWTGDGQDDYLHEVYSNAYYDIVGVSMRKPTENSLPRRILDKLQINHSEEIANEDIKSSGACDYLGAFSLLAMVSRGFLTAQLEFYEPRISNHKTSMWAQRVREALWSLVSQRWWKRMWVIQESVLAKKAIVMHGNMAAPWEVFVGAAKMLAKHQDADDISKSQMGPLKGLSQQILRIESLRVLLATGNFPDSLQLLQQFHRQSATDPRDKVFGVFGISDGSIVQPDYHMTSKEVFVQMGLKIIKKSGRLDLLAGQRPQTRLDLPSWCVDWHTPDSENEWQRLKCLKLYDASKQWRSGIYIHHAGNELLLGVDALVVDHVGHVCSELAPQEGFAKFRVMESQWSAKMRDTASSGSFWKALCGDIFYTGTDDEGEAMFERATADGQQQYALWRRDDTLFQNRKSSVHGGYLRGSTELLINITRKRNEFFHGMQIMTGGRRMFATIGGRIGVGPAETEPNDMIVILPGSSVPLLLRQSRDSTCNGAEVWQLVPDSTEVSPSPPYLSCTERHACHTVIGDAYVEGLMDGEGVTLSRTEGLGEMRRLYLA